MASETQSARLNELHAQINSCRICEGQVQDFLKPSDMKRGEIGPVTVVGLGPGNTELEKGEAFSGASGRTLDSWLRSCGADKEQPRRGVYLTSVVKCRASIKNFPTLARNCRPFLNGQLAIIKPQLIITLGAEAFRELTFVDAPFAEAVCHPFKSPDHVLMTQIGFHFTLLPWPHPSGLNRWHNDTSNRARLENSFKIVQPYLSKS